MMTSTSRNNQFSPSCLPDQAGEIIAYTRRSIRELPRDTTLESLKLEARLSTDRPHIARSHTSPLPSLHHEKRRRYDTLDQLTAHGSDDLTTNEDPATRNTSSQEHLQQSQTLSSLLLRPCHVCHRRPTSRAVLDAYADCDRCHGRSCYICLRECESMECGISSEDLQKIRIIDGRHESENWSIQAKLRRKRKVCSWCAVEGLDRDGYDIVRCLDCFEKGKDDQSPNELPLVAWLSPRAVT